MKKKIVQIIQAGLGIVLIALFCQTVYFIGVWIDINVTYKYLLWIATLDLITTLILLLSFGYERYLSQRTMKTVMELQGKLESFGEIADRDSVEQLYLCFGNSSNNVQDRRNQSERILQPVRKFIGTAFTGCKDKCTYAEAYPPQ